jgi:hypothetical protein
MEVAALVRERYRARRPVQQTHANASFKPRHGTAYARRSESKGLSGPDEIAGLHDRGQDAYAAEQSAVKCHDDFLSLKYRQRCAGGKCGIAQICRHDSIKECAMILSGKRTTVLSGSSDMGLARALAAARDEANVVTASSSKDRIDALATLPTGTEGHVLDLPTAMQSRRLSPGLLTAWSRSDEQ